MIVDYGVDVRALDDLPDPEQLVSGEDNAAHAAARRLITPSGALAEIGDTAAYESIDVRDWLGADVGASDVSDLQSQAVQILTRDPRNLAADVTVSEDAGTLTLDAQVQGTRGTYALVLAVDGVSTQLLKGVP